MENDRTTLYSPVVINDTSYSNESDNSEEDETYTDPAREAQLDQYAREDCANCTYESINRTRKNFFSKIYAQMMDYLVLRMESFYRIHVEPQLRNVWVNCCVCNATGDLEIHMDGIHHHLYACDSCAKILFERLRAQGWQDTDPRAACANITIGL
jgi:hypothetical protein